VSARIEGVIADESGARVPDARVDAVETATNLTWTATSAAEGAYALPALPPGRFRLEVRRAGFKVHATEGLRLEAGDVPRMDLTLVVGGPTEIVEVVAEARDSTARATPKSGTRTVPKRPRACPRTGATT
jgi:hypothetical protein